jgi:hypothetical protein
MNDSTIFRICSNARLVREALLFQQRIFTGHRAKYVLLRERVNMVFEVHTFDYAFECTRQNSMQNYRADSTAKPNNSLYSRTAQNSKVAQHMPRKHTFTAATLQNLPRDSSSFPLQNYQLQNYHRPPSTSTCIKSPRSLATAARNRRRNSTTCATGTTASPPTWPKRRTPEVQAPGRSSSP